MVEFSGKKSGVGISASSSLLSLLPGSQRDGGRGGGGRGESSSSSSHSYFHDVQPGLLSLPQTANRYQLQDGGAHRLVPSQSFCQATGQSMPLAAMKEIREGVGCACSSIW